MATDSTVLARIVGFLAELKKLVLSHKALPAVAGSRRRIDSARRAARPPWRNWSRSARAVGTGAIVRAWNPQVRGHREILDGSGQVRQKRGVSARREAVAAHAGSVGGPARVVDHVRSRTLVTRGICFHYVPVEDREDLVKAGESLQVGAVQVGDTAVAVPDVGRHQREALFVVLRDAITVQIKEGPGVKVILPPVNPDLSHIADRARGSRSMTQ